MQRPSSVQMLITSLFALFFFASSMVSAATTVLDNVNIINEKEKNAIILLTGNDPETFPYDQAYGLTNYWTKWDVILNDDDTYSFHLNGKYLTADSNDGIGVASSIGTNEKFFLETGNGSFYLRTWRHTYVGAGGSGWKDLVQSYERTSNEEWLFYERPDPTSGLDNVNMANYLYKNIIIMLTGNDPETFPYNQAYGANNYWTKWDVIDNGDGTHSFHLNGKYLTAISGVTDIAVVSSITTEGKFTLESGEYGTYAIKSSDGRYMACEGTGWKDVILTGTQSDATLWYFMERQSVSTFTDPMLFMDGDRIGSIDETTTNIDFVSSFESTPAILAAMQTTSGTDPSDVRIKNADINGFDIFIQEEQSNDSEVIHNNETIGFLAFEEGVIRNTSGTIIGEAGVIDVTQDSGGTWFTLDNFIGTYSDPVVIMTINSQNGSHAGHMRIKNVNDDYFKYQLEEWDYLDGSHATESVSYLIVEKGVHSLEKGGVLQAQEQKLDHNWETVTFASTHSATPVVLSQTQTTNGSASVTTRQQSISTNSVSVKLQEQEADNGTHDDEWVAVVSWAN